MKKGRMKRFVIVCLSMTVASLLSVPACADVFEHDDFVIAGDSDNTYRYSLSQEEPADKLLRYPPSGEFFEYGNQVFFQAGSRLYAYTFGEEEAREIEFIGAGNDISVHFAGVLGNRLFLVIREGFLSYDCQLKYYDFEKGSLEDFLPKAYDACVWDDKLFVTVYKPNEDNPEERSAFFGYANDDLSSLSILSSTPGYTLENSEGPAVYADENGLYYWELNAETGDSSLMRVEKNDSDGSLSWHPVGVIPFSIASVEYLGVVNGNLFIKVTKDDSSVLYESYDAETDEFHEIVFTGVTSEEDNVRVYIKENALYYYITEKMELWEASIPGDTPLSENDPFSEEDRLLCVFPEETGICGITGSAVYFVSGGELYYSSLKDIESSETETVSDGEKLPDHEVLISEIAEGLDRERDKYQLSSIVLPEVFKANPSVETWLKDAKGKPLDISISVSENSKNHAAEGLTQSDDSETDGTGKGGKYEFTATYDPSERSLGVRENSGQESLLPEITFTIQDQTLDIELSSDSGKTNHYSLPFIPALIPENAAVSAMEDSLSDLLKDSEITAEDGACDLGLRLTKDHPEGISIEVPCRVYHTTLSWKKVLEATTSVYELLIKATGMEGRIESLPDMGELITRIEQMTEGGPAVSFYVTGQGCQKIEMDIIKIPGIRDVSGAPVRAQRISSSEYGRGISASVMFRENNSSLQFDTDEDISVLTDLDLTADVEISSGNYPERQFFKANIMQTGKPSGEVREHISVSVPIPGIFGTDQKFYSLSAVYSPEANGITLNMMFDEPGKLISLSVNDPYAEENILHLPIKINLALSEMNKYLEGEMVLEIK